MTPAEGRRGVRLAELLATVSLASDLAHAVPAESALRDAVVSVRLAQRAGWSKADMSDVYYLALLYHVGCTGAVSIQSPLGGDDDIAVRRLLSEADFADRPEMMRITVTQLARRWGPRQWAAGVAAMIGAGEAVPVALASVADVAVRLSARMGASPPVSAALSHAYARWDGKVFSDLPSRDGLSAIARLVHLVHVAQTYSRAGGREAADATVHDRSGGEFDPELARLWLHNSHDVLDQLGHESVWDDALAAEPEPHRLGSPAHLDEVCRALADFVDLKSPYTGGHSPQLARLVEGAGAEMGLPPSEITTLRRAAEVHDLGNVSIPDLVWAKRGPLNRSEQDRVRLHTYHGERILSLSAALRGSGELVGLHHERIDGSGYHRGLRAAALSPGARLLAAAEMYQSIREKRAWRPALDPASAARELRQEVAAGRLDRRAAEARADGRRRPVEARQGSSGMARRTDRPGGRGPPTARSRAFQQTDRGRPARLPGDRSHPRDQRVRKDRCQHAGGGHPVRPRARPDPGLDRLKKSTERLMPPPFGCA
ncbi:MAG: LuxR family transcriptional regulator [Candidatus Nephthysia bennettiae]|nr:MAG: LuxR family transcriptional regulator [Candidatus Dormibacteraeota bacterium]